MARTIEEYKRKQEQFRGFQATCRKRVMEWLDENFEPGSFVKTEEVTAVPGGVRVTDRDGQTMLVWYEAWKEEVRYRIGDEDKRN